jgi:hypothetical protein
MTPYLPARIAALASFVFVLVMNSVATALPLNGLSVGGVSDKYTTLFAPIDFTFGIWGLIYLGLTVYSFTQLFTDNQVIQRITPWFIAANIFNGSWIIAWRLEWLLVSSLILVGLLFCLYKINKETTSKSSSAEQTITTRLPFEIYFGWVTVATIANISSFLVQLGFQDGYLLDAQTWTVVILIVATLIGTATALVNSSPAYSLVILWAFYGIYSRHISPFEWNLQYPNIILATQILMAVLGVVSVVAGVRWLKAHGKSTQASA